MDGNDGSLLKALPDNCSIMNCFRSGILLSVGSYGMWLGGTGSDRFGCDRTDCGTLASGTVTAAISVVRIGCGNDADKMCLYMLAY